MESGTASEVLVMALIRGEGAPADRRCCRTVDSCAPAGNLAAEGFADIYSVLKKSVLGLDLV